MENPWLDLPESKKFVLPLDRPYVEAFNAEADERHKLNLGVLPQPFLGIRDADLLLLGRNPGTRGWREGSYAQALKHDLMSASGTPFPPLLEGFVENEGAWWAKCFKSLLKGTGKPPSWLAQRVMAVEFHGYHSERWRAIPVTLPSQRYSFWLVEKAIQRQATIVIMRGSRDWKIAVPALHEARLVVLNNPRSGTISPGNCAGDGFRQVLDALA